MPVPRVFVSSGGFRTPPLDALRELRAAGVADVELSGGVHQVGLRPALAGTETAAGRLQVHNYFPPPPEPFVFNLCDPDADGRERSVQFACDAVELGASLGSSVYSFHAGFLGTPAVSDLGRIWGVTNKLGLDEGTELFARSVERVNSFARERGVRLLVENNVLTVGTAASNGEDVLLMTTPEGIRATLACLPPDVGLLMDVAHFAVSARTLGFDSSSALRDLSPLIGGYHLSDNDGLVDSNDPVREDSWFWDALDPAVPYVTLEIHPGKVGSYAEQVALTERKLATRAQHS